MLYWIIYKFCTSNIEEKDKGTQTFIYGSIAYVLTYLLLNSSEIKKIQFLDYIRDNFWWILITDFVSIAILFKDFQKIPEKFGFNKEKVQEFQTYYDSVMPNSRFNISPILSPIGSIFGMTQMGKKNKQFDSDIPMKRKVKRVDSDIEVYNPSKKKRKKHSSKGGVNSSSKLSSKEIRSSKNGKTDQQLISILQSGEKRVKKGKSDKKRN